MKTHYTTVFDAILSKKQAASVARDEVKPATSEQIDLRDATTGIWYHVEEALSKLVLEALTARHKGVDNRLSAVLKSLMERIVKKIVNSPETVSQIEEAVIDNPGFFALTTAIVNSKQRECTEGRSKLEQRCLQFFEPGMKLDSVTVSHMPEIGGNHLQLFP